MTPWEERVAEVVAAATRLDGDPAESVEQVVRSRFALADDHQRERLRSSALARMTGHGLIGELLAERDVDEVLVHRVREVWTERAGRLERRAEISDGELEVVLERMLAGSGRRLDRSHPVVDARLADGSRLCAVLPPVAVDGTAVAVRAPARRRLRLDDFGPCEVVEQLTSAVDRRSTILVSGGASSGKTSLLGALLDVVSDEQRVVIIEDTAELNPRHPQSVRLETRPRAEGISAIDAEDLVRAALRLRPDRLVVGEIRGSEVVALIQAINTGHDGALATCHANSATDALTRLENLLARTMPSWSAEAARDHLRSTIDLLVHLRRLPTGQRLVSEIVELTPTGPRSLLEAVSE